MKKNKLLVFGFAVTAMLALSSCEFFLPFFNSSSDPYSYKTEQPTTSNDISVSSEETSTTSEQSDGPISSSSEVPSSTTSSSSSSLPTSSTTSAPSSSSTSSSSSEQPYAPIEAQHASSTYKNVFKNHIYTLSSTPAVGEANIIVVPVWFQDSNGFIATSYRNKVREDIENAYFGTNEETGWRSVKTYYEEESHGALTYNGIVTDWYECGKRYSYYGNDDEATTKTKALVAEVTDWYFTQNPSVSRKDYDKDGDGYLDGIMLIYAAPDYSAGHAYQNYENLWAYCYWLQDSSAKNVNNPGTNAYFWASYDFMYGSNKVLERTGLSVGPHSGDTRNCSVDAHTFIHEMGHMFGLDDYYDYSGQYTPAGNFSMQDSATAGHDPFSSFALGWGKAYIPAESMTIKLRPFATSGEMILLTPQFNQYGSPFDEYLLLEYYSPTGLNAFDTKYIYMNSYPRGSQEVGIRLWHVDARLYYVINSIKKEYAFTTNPNLRNYRVDVAMRNTYEGFRGQDYVSALGSSYYNFNLLQLIRNNPAYNYKPTDTFDANSLFREGSSFSMSKCSGQFVKAGKLNQNIDLGYSFTVNKTVTDYAEITITKA